MAFNPFLSMGDPEPIQTETLNPFMMGSEEEQVVASSDNPFAASNPFADFGSSMYEPNVEETPSMDIFGTTNSSSANNNNGYKDLSSSPFVTEAMDFTSESTMEMTKPTQIDLSTNTVNSSKDIFLPEDDSQKPKRPPPPPPARPLPPETQNLLTSVTDHMDFTSSHLLDRIPPTRTPSPVSMRDLHSPSPTPDPDINFEDFPSDNPDVNIEQSPARNLIDVNQNKPTRPPPARPPPARPQPPPIPPSISQHNPPVPSKTSEKTQDDDINLFDAPVRPVVKPTKEAILSLYSAPKQEEKPIDFLSDDNIIMENVTEQKDSSGSSSPKVSTVHESSPPHTTFTSDAIVTPEHPSSNISIENISAIDTNEVGNMSETERQTDNENNIFGASESPHFAEENVISSSSNNIFRVMPDQYSDTKADTVNPFEAMDTSAYPAASSSIFGSSPFDNSETEQKVDPFTSVNAPILKSDSGFGEAIAPEITPFAAQSDEFDAFSAKFDAFSKPEGPAGGSAWGEGGDESSTGAEGFEADETFDEFLSMQAPPPAPAATPLPVKEDSQDSDDGNFNVFIKPKGADASYGGGVPVLAPPPRPQALPESPRVNPFDSQPFPEAIAEAQPRIPMDGERKKSGGDTPPTPLFDEDVSQPLEEFPRVVYDGPGWEMQLRQPNKKKITGQRFWKKIFVKLTFQGDNPVVQLYNSQNDKDPFQELPLQACYSVSEIGAQQYDQFGKIFTIKLQYIFYKERPGVRPGQVTKAERITNKLSQFAAYAIQGDYQGVKEFGSDLKKLGLPVEHAPQISQLFKIGSLNYEDVKQFSVCIEEALFKLNAHRDRALTYKMEEVQITAVDELYAEQDAEGSVQKQIARVRLFFLGFLSGMPDIELGVNDMRRQGKEVVGRHDIIPVATEEWIRVENAEFHACVQPEEFAKTQILKFKPPDACYIELMRFRIRPPKNRELPLQLKAVMCVTGNKVELRADVLVPGFASRSLGQVPCEDVMIRFPIPECWIYLFRVEKHFRYGSVKSAHRRTGKIKGIERFLGTVETLQESLIEVTSGQAKYEHQHRAIVWRMPRLPKEGQGAYTTHNLVCRMALTSYDQIPPELAKFAYVEFTMPATQVSHMTVRSVSLQNHDSDEPPEKYVRYLARHEYVVGIEHTTGSMTAAYVAAAAVPTQPAPQLAPVPQAPSSDSDSD